MNCAEILFAQKMESKCKYYIGRNFLLVCLSKMHMQCSLRKFSLKFLQLEVIFSIWKFPLVFWVNLKQVLCLFVIVNNVTVEVFCKLNTSHLIDFLSWNFLHTVWHVEIRHSVSSALGQPMLRNCNTYPQCRELKKITGHLDIF